MTATLIAVLNVSDRGLMTRGSNLQRQPQPALVAHGNMAYCLMILLTIIPSVCRAVIVHPAMIGHSVLGGYGQKEHVVRTPATNPNKKRWPYRRLGLSAGRGAADTFRSITYLPCFVRSIPRRSLYLTMREREEEMASMVRDPRPDGRTMRARMDVGGPDGISQETRISSRRLSVNQGHPSGFLLDPAQEACIFLHPETPAVLLTAGAGTGKTQTLAARLAWLLGVEVSEGSSSFSAPGTDTVSGQGARRSPEVPDHGQQAGHGIGGRRAGSEHAETPESILVLSFTNQGALDVRDRAVALGLSEGLADRVWTATFHSFAATILSQNAHLVWCTPRQGSQPRSRGHDGHPGSSFRIVGPDEQLALVARAMQRVRHSPPSRQRSTAVESGLNGRVVLADDGGRGPRPAALEGSWGMPGSAFPQDSENVRASSDQARRAVLSRLTTWKEEGLTPEDIMLREFETDGESNRAAAEVYEEYQRLLRSQRQLDFGDLCLTATELLSRHPEVLARYRWRLRHVLVDEYQDTSPIQQRLLKMLVVGTPSAATDAAGNDARHPNPEAGERLDRHPGLGVSLFCAGDEDQHIYGWRGTTVEHLFSFEDDFPGAVRCTLTETHRLPVHLLRSATGLMRSGGLAPLLNKRMRTKRNTGAVVRAQGLWNSREEGKYVAREAARIHKEEGISYRDMAVIARTSYNTRELEESLVSRGVPYARQGGPSFFSRPELQAPLALLALCLDPQDDGAFRHFFSFRSLACLQWATPGTMRTIAALSMAKKVSMAEATRLSVSQGRLEGGDAAGFISRLRRWSGLLVGWSRLGGKERASVVRCVFGEAGFLRPAGNLRSEPHSHFAVRGAYVGASDEDSDEHESIGQLATAVSRCDHIGRFLLRAVKSGECARKGRPGRGGRWEGTTRGDASKPGAIHPSSSEEAIELMTMHQAKGREFKVVFLTGWDEGSFPLLPKSKPRGGGGDGAAESLVRLQEERRLGYVALTRAKEHAIITFSKKRRVNDIWVKSSGPSRFLLELPTEYVELSPSALGRILNDYPGMAVGNELIFNEIKESNTLRRGKRPPGHPSLAQIRVYNEAASRAKRGWDGAELDNAELLPPGCTIINRAKSVPGANADAAEAGTLSAGSDETLALLKTSRWDSRSSVSNDPEAANGEMEISSGTPATQHADVVASATSTEKRSRSVSTSLLERECEERQGVGAKVARYRAPVIVPGPRRGRRKLHLDASEVTAEPVVDATRVAELISDPTIHQGSLKNYLRAVLAVQHGCVRGSIPAWPPRRDEASGRRPCGSRASERVPLSLSSVAQLALHIIRLLEKKTEARADAETKRGGASIRGHSGRSEPHGCRL